MTPHSKTFTQYAVQLESTRRDDPTYAGLGKRWETSRLTPRFYARRSDAVARANTLESGGNWKAEVVEFATTFVEPRPTLEPVEVKGIMFGEPYLDEVDGLWYFLIETDASGPYSSPELAERSRQSYIKINRK